MRVTPVDGDRLRTLRETKRFSQRKLAEKAGLARSQIQKLEAGGSAFGTTLHGLAEALEVEISEFTKAA